VKTLKHQTKNLILLLAKSSLKLIPLEFSKWLLPVVKGQRSNPGYLAVDNSHLPITCLQRQQPKFLTMFNYKGYTASVKLDPSSKKLVGKVIDLSDSITFEGRDVAELVEDFYNAVDSYLEFCEEVGKQPNKPYSGNLMYRTDAETHRKIASVASSQGLSINAWMDKTLKEALMDELRRSSQVVLAMT
jgi:predicted HicB family RNase H-like nuclease